MGGALFSQRSLYIPLIFGRLTQNHESPVQGSRVKLARYIIVTKTGFFSPSG